MFDSVTRYWTVVERNIQQLPLSGIFLYNRLIWAGAGLVSLAAVWISFPMSVEALTSKISGKRAAKAKKIEEEDARPARSFVAAALPRIHQLFGPGTSWTQFWSLTRLRMDNILREVPFWAILRGLSRFRN